MLVLKFLATLAGKVFRSRKGVDWKLLDEIVSEEGESPSIMKADKVAAVDRRFDSYYEEWLTNERAKTIRAQNDLAAAGVHMPFDNKS